MRTTPGSNRRAPPGHPVTTNGTVRTTAPGTTAASRSCPVTTAARRQPSTARTPSRRSSSGASNRFAHAGRPTRRRRARPRPTTLCSSTGLGAGQDPHAPRIGHYVLPELHQPERLLRVDRNFPQRVHRLNPYPWTNCFQASVPCLRHLVGRRYPAVGGARRRRRKSFSILSTPFTRRINK